jgi:hypothetical protein
MQIVTNPITEIVCCGQLIKSILKCHSAVRNIQGDVKQLNSAIADQFKERNAMNIFKLIP